MRAALHSLLALAFLPCVAHAEYRSISTARDGTQTMNRLVSPLDQAGVNLREKSFHDITSGRAEARPSKFRN